MATPTGDVEPRPCVEPRRGIAEVDVQRERIEALRGPAGQRLDQPRSNALAAGVLGASSPGSALR